MKSLPLMLCLLLPVCAAAEVVVPIDKVEQHVNIRMSPDSKSEIVGRLPQGEWRNVVDTVDGWYEVEIAGGATGFISADWTVLLDAPPPVEPEPAVDEVVAEKPAVGEAVLADADGAIRSGAEDGAAPDVVTARASTAHSTLAEAPAAASEENRDEPVDEATAAVGAPEAAELAREETPPTVEAAVADTIDTDASDAGASDELQTVAVVRGPQGPQGPAGPQGPPGAAKIEGTVDYLMKFTAPTIGGNSQVFDDGNNIGIGTTSPKQRLEVNGNIQIHEQNSSVAGLMITQSSGETGYIMHNRASTLTIGAGSIDRITIDRHGNVGFGTARPTHPLEFASGAHVTAGGVFTNSASRDVKEDVEALSPEAALETLAALEPVRFRYSNDGGEEYVGFIAEDVPDLVATADRKGLSPMDIVAVLTRVVQEQQKKIAELEAKLDQR